MHTTGPSLYPQRFGAQPAKPAPKPVTPPAPGTPAAPGKTAVPGVQPPFVKPKTAPNPIPPCKPDKGHKTCFE